MKATLPGLRIAFVAAAAFYVCSPPQAFAQRGDIVLSGREATAVQLAVDDFLRHRYSASGNLARYTVRVVRSRKQLEITFVPGTDSRGPYPGGRTDYGPEITYYVLLNPPKILKHLFAQ